MSGVCELSGVDDLLAIGDFGRNNGSFGGYGRGRSQQAEGSGIMEEVSLWYDALTLDPSGVVVVRDQEALGQMVIFESKFCRFSIITSGTEACFCRKQDLK